MKKYCLSVLLFSIVTAIQSWIVQVLPLNVWENLSEYPTVYFLFFIDFMAALCCIFAGKMVALLVCTVQTVLCIFISSYVVSLGSVPSLSVAVDNVNLMYGFKIDQLADYLSVKYFFITTALYGIQCICARFIYEKSCLRVC